METAKNIIHLVHYRGKKYQINSKNSMYRFSCAQASDIFNFNNN